MVLCHYAGHVDCPKGEEEDLAVSECWRWLLQCASLLVVDDVVVVVAVVAILLFEMQIGMEDHDCHIGEKGLAAVSELPTAAFRW
jgi:hypothetical protein